MGLGQGFRGDTYSLSVDATRPSRLRQGAEVGHSRWTGVDVVDKWVRGMAPGHVKSGEMDRVSMSAEILAVRAALPAPPSIGLVEPKGGLLL